MKTKRATTCTQGIALPNEKPDASKPLEFRLPMVYGNYPYGEIPCPDGVRRMCSQTWDRSAAERCAAAIPNEGFPIYEGHPDVPDLAAKYPNKAAIGWASGIEVGPEGAVIVGEWNEESPGKGFKFFSPYFTGRVLSVANDESACTLEIDEIRSVGLVNRPNIKSFSLANEQDEEETQTKGAIMDLKKLAVKLGLPETATEAEVEAKIASMTADLTAAKAASDTAKTEADNAKKEIEAAKTACANERTARIETILGHAIASGAIVPAAKPAWAKQLTDDFDKGVAALANEETKIKTKSAAAAGGGDGAKKPGGLTALANEEMKKTPGLSFEEAWKIAKASTAAQK